MQDFPAPGFLRRKAKAGFWSRRTPVYQNHDSFVTDPVMNDVGRQLAVTDPRAIVPYIVSSGDPVVLGGVLIFCTGVLT